MNSIFVSGRVRLLLRRSTPTQVIALILISMCALLADEGGEDTWKHPDSCTESDEHFWNEEWHSCVLLTIQETRCVYSCEGIPASCYKYLPPAN